MTKWNETTEAAAFIASADSYRTATEIMRAIAFFSRNAAEANAIWEGDGNYIARIPEIWEHATNSGQIDDTELYWGDRSLADICADSDEIKYSFGKYVEESDGKMWERIASQFYQCDAQAELSARQLCEDLGIDGVFIRRAGAEWYRAAN